MTKKQKISMGLFGSAAVGMCILIFCFPKETAQGVRQSLALCAYSIIPSLFVFTVLSQILIRCRVFSRFARMGKLFGLSGAGVGVVLTGLLCGFPTSATTAATLCQKGEMTKEEARRILPYCSNAGMAFVVGTVGETMFSDKKTGVILYFLQTGLSLVFLLLSAKKRKSIVFLFESTHPYESPVSVLVCAVSDAGKAMITVCAFILFFGSAADFFLLLFGDFLPEVVTPLVCGFLEIGRGCSACAALADRFPLLSRCLAAWTLGFSGLSVACQIKEGARGVSVSLPAFLTCKMLFALAMAGVVFIWQKIGLAL